MKKFGNILIIGDSYSTFDGYIPKDYDTWYTKDSEKTDVHDVTETWWWQLVKETDSNLIQNESFSGTTICNTERPNIPHTSFYYRLEENLIANGFFENNPIDTIFLFGGTNDSWIDSPIGDIDNINFDEESLKHVLPAFYYIVKRLQSVAPSSKIIVVINSDIKPSIQEGFAKICEKLSVTYIQLKDIHKQNGHPDKQGMTEIKAQIISSLFA